MNVSRRWVLVAGGLGIGALAVGATLAPRALRWWRNRRRADPLGTGGWVVIAPDGAVTVRLPVAEMGQGSQSALARVVADELGADWARVAVTHAPVAQEFRAPWGFTTASSRTLKGLYVPMRLCGAAAREMLIAEAAARLQVPAGECAAAGGMVTHAPSGRRLAFAELAAAAATRPVPSSPQLRPQRDWQLVGQRGGRADTPAKVDGTATFGIDVRQPGMRFATVLACPHAGGRLEGVDDAAARAAPGVERVVIIDDAVAVVARTTWQAMAAARLLAPRWSKPGASDTAAMMRELDAAATAALAAQPAAPAGAATLRYDLPLLYHAQLEPLNATVGIAPTDGAVTVWAPTQAPAEVRADVAAALGIDESRVTVHPQVMGGGFGRRLRTDDAVLAARIAARAGGTVQLVYSREEDLRQGRFRPAVVALLRAKASERGDGISGHLALAASDGEPRVGGLDPLPYRNLKLGATAAAATTHVRGGSWRSVDLSHNLFIVESAIDELLRVGSTAAAFDARLALLGDNTRARGALLALRSRLGTATAGIALVEWWGAVCATGVEVELSGTEVIVTRITCVVDCGLVVDPTNAEAQVAGAALLGLSAAALEQVTLAGGLPQAQNLDRYPTLRISDTPPVEVAFVGVSDTPLGGLGELGVPGVAPALCNAIAIAGGPRLRSLPLSAQGLALRARRANAG